MKNLFILILCSLIFPSIAEELDMEFMKDLSEGMVEQELINNDASSSIQDSTSLNRDAPYSKKGSCTGVLGFNESEEFQKDLEFMYGKEKQDRVLSSTIESVTGEYGNKTIKKVAKDMLFPAPVKAAITAYEYGKKMYDINEGYQSGDVYTYLDKVPWKGFSEPHRVAFEDLDYVGQKMETFIPDLEKEMFSEQDKLVPIPVETLEPYINTSYDPTNDINAYNQRIGSISSPQTLSDPLHNKTPTYLEHLAKQPYLEPTQNTTPNYFEYLATKPNTNFSEYLATQHNIKTSPVADFNYSEHLAKQSGFNFSEINSSNCTDILLKQSTFDPSKIKTNSTPDYTKLEFDKSK